MPRLSLDQKIETIVQHAKTGPSANRRSLMHAYIACLSASELCKTLERSWDWPTHLHQALAKRLEKLKLGSEEGRPVHRFLAHKLASRSMPRKQRVRFDALLSRLYPHLPLELRERTLERWLNLGTREANSRWLKAVSNDDSLRDLGQVISYWRSTRDDRAARLITDVSPLDDLTSILEELVAHSHEGWIASRAVMKAGQASEACWATLKERFPATYAYLCVKLDRPLSERAALELVRASKQPYSNSQIGLAIWAIGQKGMWRTLDLVEDILDEFDDEYLKHIGVRLYAEESPN